MGRKKINKRDVMGFYCVVCKRIHCGCCCGGIICKKCGFGICEECYDKKPKTCRHITEKEKEHYEEEKGLIQHLEGGGHIP